MPEEEIPIASAAAFVPRAAPLKKYESKVLTLDDADLAALARPPATPDGPAATAAVAVSAHAAPPIDRLGALRDLARKLRSAPDSEGTLQHVIDETCRCTRSDAGMLTLSAPMSRQYVCGAALGAGPYISVPLRAGGPSFGEIVLTRLADGEEYAAEEETFAELVSEYVAKAVSTLRAGTVIPQESQDFIDRITQELRAPLAGALNTVRVAVAADEASDDTRRYLKAAHGDLRRMLGTIDGLVTLAHLRPPGLSEMQTVALTPLLEQAVAEARPYADDRGVTLALEPPAEAFLTTGVEDQLRAVVAELLANAIKFTDPGGRVEVTAGIDEGELRVSVRDTGIGFDGAEAVRMTECFNRAITAEAGRYPGLGVGLFLASQIVEHHGGKLWLKSRRDEGTQAFVALPQRHEGI